jgi:hypothetical protein
LARRYRQVVACRGSCWLRGPALPRSLAPVYRVGASVTPDHRVAPWRHAGPTGRDTSAQGNAMGVVATEPCGLKGRDEGDEAGAIIAPRWGAGQGEDP